MYKYREWLELNILCIDSIHSDNLLETHLRRYSVQHTIIYCLPLSWFETIYAFNNSSGHNKSYIGQLIPPVSQKTRLDAN